MKDTEVTEKENQNAEKEKQNAKKGKSIAEKDNQNAEKEKQNTENELRNVGKDKKQSEKEIYDAELERKRIEFEKQIVKYEKQQVEQEKRKIEKFKAAQKLKSAEVIEVDNPRERPVIFKQKVKFVLLISNILLLIIASGACSVGAWSVIEPQALTKMFGTSMYCITGIILIAVGVIGIVVSLSGLLGSVLEKRALLLVYLVIQFLIFSILMLLIVMGVFVEFMDYQNVKTNMLETMGAYSYIPVVKYLWDFIQQHLECCGIAEFKGGEPWRSWSNHTMEFAEGKWVPKSCCILQNENITTACQNFPTDKNAFQDDCFENLKMLVSRNAILFTTCGIGFGMFLVITITFGCIMLISYS